MVLDTGSLIMEVLMSEQPRGEGNFTKAVTVCAALLTIIYILKEMAGWIA